MPLSAWARLVGALLMRFQRTAVPACPELCVRVLLLTLPLILLFCVVCIHFPPAAAAFPCAGARGLALPTFTDAPIRSWRNPARAVRAARWVSARTATGCAYPLPTRTPRSARPVRDPALPDSPAPPRPVSKSLFVAAGVGRDVLQLGRSIEKDRGYTL